MSADAVLKAAFAMPLHSPSYPVGPYRFVDREYVIVSYRTDREILEQLVPEPLEVAEPIVKCEFIRMPDSTGFGAYQGLAQVISVRYAGETGGYTHAMYLDAHAPIAGGRELWGFPQKLARPALSVERDAMVGTLNCGPVKVAVGTMGYKHKAIATEAAHTFLAEPGFVLKIIPDVDGSPRICELVRYRLRDVKLKGAWTAPGSLSLSPHALAPVADIPVREVIFCVHIIADLTLELGEVVHDYMA